MYQRGRADFGPAGEIAMRLPAFVRATALDTLPSPFRLAVDLGEDIGSPTWFRGAATLAVMIATLLRFAPATAPLPRDGRAAPRQEEKAHTIGRILYAPGPSSDSHVIATADAPAPDVPSTAGDATPFRISGLVRGGLYRSERAAGIPAPIVAAYLRAIGPRVDFDAIRAGDRFDLVVERGQATTGKVKTGGLLYAALHHGDEHLQLLRWSLDGDEQWFDADGIGGRRSGFTMPVAGARLTSGFGMRVHPLFGSNLMHEGVDLAVPDGTPIVAASAGVVRFAGWHGGHGNFVQIAHSGGLGTGYGHMSSFVVAPGSIVQQGELIGYVGSTGLTTGPHLHFEIYRDGVPIDPASASFDATARLHGADLIRFRAELARLAALPVRGGQPSALARGPAPATAPVGASGR